MGRRSCVRLLLIAATLGSVGADPSIHTVTRGGWVAGSAAVEGDRCLGATVVALSLMAWLRSGAGHYHRVQQVLHMVGRGLALDAGRCGRAALPPPRRPGGRAV